MALRIHCGACLPSRCRAPPTCVGSCSGRRRRAAAQRRWPRVHTRAGAAAGARLAGPASCARVCPVCGASLASCGAARRAARRLEPPRYPRRRGASPLWLFRRRRVRGAPAGARARQTLAQLAWRARRAARPEAPEARGVAALLGHGGLGAASRSCLCFPLSPQPATQGAGAAGRAWAWVRAWRAARCRWCLARLP